MRLRQAVNRFNKTPLEGYDQASGVWVPDVVRGNFQVADRFISDRSFGQRKRNFLTAEMLPLGYELFRMGGSVIYMLESTELDMEGSTVLGYINMIHELAYPCQLIRLTSNKRNSGGSLPATRTVVAETWCDLDRYGQDTDKALGPVVMPTYNVTFPSSLLDTVTSDMILSVNGDDYDLDMVSHNLEAGWARATIRGAA